ncbi:MAG: hypothetical protein AAB665_03775 [Patescibacteria group bacterium]
MKIGYRMRELECMAIAPIQIFNSADERAKKFLGTGKGPKDKDNLRAAVVFEVAAIDAYFRAKVVRFLKTQYEKSLKDFKMPFAAQKLIRLIVEASIEKKKGATGLDKIQKRIIRASAETTNSQSFYLLEEALKRHQTFQSIEQISHAFRIMGKNPDHTWSLFDLSTKTKDEKKAITGAKKRGPKKKNKRGPKIDAKKQMNRLFGRRHLIVHEADIFLTGKQRTGHKRPIEYEMVKKWLEKSGEAIHRIA